MLCRCARSAGYRRGTPTRANYQNYPQIHKHSYQWHHLTPSHCRNRLPIASLCEKIEKVVNWSRKVEGFQEPEWFQVFMADFAFLEKDEQELAIKDMEQIMITSKYRSKYMEGFPIEYLLQDFAELEPYKQKKALAGAKEYYKTQKLPPGCYLQLDPEQMTIMSREDVEDMKKKMLGKTIDQVNLHELLKEVQRERKAKKEQEMKEKEQQQQKEKEEATMQHTQDSNSSNHTQQ